jgi:hypothetical protein
LMRVVSGDDAAVCPHSIQKRALQAKLIYFNVTN